MNDRETWVDAYLRVAMRVLPARARGESYEDQPLGITALIIVSAATALAIFCIGAAVAGVFGFASLYVWQTAPTIYLGVAGIAWVMFWGGWAGQRLRAIENEGAFAFRDRTAYREVFADRLRHIVNRRAHIGVAAVTTVLICTYVVVATYGRHKLALFPDQWSRGTHLWAKNLVLYLYGVPILFLAVTMFAGVVGYLGLVRALSRLDLVFTLEVAQLKLRPIANWGIWTGFGWSVAISTVVIFFRPSLEKGGWSAVPGAIVVGGNVIAALVLFLSGQILIHRALVRAKREVLDKICETLDELHADVDSTAYVSRAVQADVERVQGLLRTTAGASEWVYSAPVDLLVFAGQALIPVISLLLVLLVGNGP